MCVSLWTHFQGHQPLTWVASERRQQIHASQMGAFEATMQGSRMSAFQALICFSRIDTFRLHTAQNMYMPLKWCLQWAPGFYECLICALCGLLSMHVLVAYSCYKFQHAHKWTSINLVGKFHNFLVRAQKAAFLLAGYKNPQAVVYLLGCYLEPDQHTIFTDQMQFCHLVICPDTNVCSPNLQVNGALMYVVILCATWPNTTMMYLCCAYELRPQLCPS